MRHPALIALGLGLALAAATPPATAEEAAAEWHESRDPMPFDIIRSLQFLQDQVARGNSRAIRVQALLLQRFGPVFLEAGAESWKDPRNRRAAVFYVLSGGTPATLAGLLAADVLPKEHRALFEGALAYVRNDLRRAGELLGALDLAAEEPGLAGHLHLVLGQIFQESDPAAAVTNLDQARLLAPGGLVEEAALRLQTMLVDGLGDHARADTLARRYFDRYARSSYAGNFEARFAAMLSARGAAEPAAAVASMEDTLYSLPAARQGAIYLTVGRRALVEGRLEFARLSVAKALDTAALEPRDQERARLYVAAASVAALPARIIERDLAAIDRRELHPEDAKLLDAALQTVAAIDGAFDAAAVAAVAGPAPLSPTVERAERILGETATATGNAVR